MLRYLFSSESVPHFLWINLGWDHACEAGCLEPVLAKFCEFLLTSEPLPFMRFGPSVGYEVCGESPEVVLIPYSHLHRCAKATDLCA